MTVTLMMIFKSWASREVTATKTPATLTTAMILDFGIIHLVQFTAVQKQE